MTDTTRSSLIESFTPKLISMMAERYRWAEFRADAIAGLTVAIVALPLSMAIAVASGVSPDRGLTAAIIGGFVVSALGGSRFQIGGPAGAFIVLVAATTAKFGVEGVLIATFLSGLMLTIGGAVRLGSLIRHIPHPVTVGFTTGIATVILASQLKDFLGLTLAGAEPGPLPQKLAALGGAIGTVNAAAIGIGLAVSLIIAVTRRYAPKWPGMLIAVASASIAAALFHLPVETIASRFGAIAGGLPIPHLPEVTLAKVTQVLPAALAFTLLGGIESLLSATVADGMTGRKHRSNLELMAQGLANMASALFGGISVTGTIARTATNVRAGAHGPVSGMLHSVFLLAFLVLAAPLAGFIPLAALAGVLIIVAWNMAEKREIRTLLVAWDTGLVLAATFLTTILRDLTAGIIAGCLVAVAIALFKRLGKRR